MKAENLAAVGQGDWLIPTSKQARDAIQQQTGGKNGWTADAGRRGLRRLRPRSSRR